MPIMQTPRSNRFELPDGTETWSVRGRLIRDWVGLTELQVQLVERGESTVVAEAPRIWIEAGKIAQGRDFWPVRGRRRLFVCGTARRLRQNLFRPGTGASGGRIGPGGDRCTHTSRDRSTLHGPPRDCFATGLSIAGEAGARASDRGARSERPYLEEACFDPTLAVRHRGRIAFREQIREVAVPHFNLPENASSLAS